jgi:ribosome recycling factor
VNPNTDGQSIRLNMPALTRERRQDLVKFLHKRTEEARVPSATFGAAVTTTCASSRKKR